MLNFVKKYAKPLLTLQIGVFILILVNLGVNLAQPLIIKKVIDAYESKILSLISAAGLCSIFLALVLCEFITGSMRDILINKTRGLLQFKLRNDIYQKSLRVSNKHSSGKITSMIYQDVDAVVGLLNIAIISIVTDCILIVFTLGILFTFSWKLAIVSILIIPIYFMLFYLSRKRIYNLNMIYKEQIGQMTETLQTGIQQKFLATKFNRQKNSGAMFCREQAQTVRLSLKLYNQQSFLYNCSNFLTNVFPFLLLIFGGYLLVQGSITLGTLIAFSTYIVKLLQPVSRLTQINVAIQSALSSVHRLYYFLNDNENWKGTHEFDTLNSGISVKDVSYTYDGENVVLNSINFDVDKNNMVAIVGKSGSGKSTLLKLLTGELNPTSGVVEYSGLKVTDIRKESFYNKIAIVNQEEEVIPGTIYENIAYGCKVTSIKNVEEVARKVGLHDFICSLSKGYNTYIKPGSIELSVGQKQRIAIARALIHQAEILIFDEMTSALDAQTESIILELLKDIKKRYTIILIAHKFQNVIFADEIFVLDNGIIVEKGNHEQLMNNKGIYFELYNKQQANLMVPSY
ncbi:MULTISPECIES: ABC transporter ATP-binding protein [unclassified Bacillus cereus group]|uniref:ABC transporter ATP-binding protein n=1 Tax=unclassified Bacillus cereus group TaxID=2750818 RepID=UPI0024CBB09A|nr:MAG: ABC transporter ATP-binding protein [Bacillus paranthracis]WAI36564.1 MAG: ABC transporter ATP-binding protein [Bacillus paranthracis]